MGYRRGAVRTTRPTRAPVSGRREAAEGRRGRRVPSSYVAPVARLVRRPDCSASCSGKLPYLTTALLAPLGAAGYARAHHADPRVRRRVESNPLGGRRNMRTVQSSRRGLVVGTALVLALTLGWAPSLQERSRRLRPRPRARPWGPSERARSAHMRDVPCEARMGRPK